eukprot:gene5378-7456_t
MSKVTKSLGRITLKRIMRDLKELEENSNPTFTYWADTDDITTGHATIHVKDGPYKNISIHILISLPLLYPDEPPSAYIEESFPFDHSHHEHVHYKGSICCDLTSNYHFGKEEGTGWTPACTITSLLIQLGTFFSDPEFIERKLSLSDVKKLRIATSQYTCIKCGYSNLNPPTDNFSTHESMTQIENVKLRTDGIIMDGSMIQVQDQTNELTQQVTNIKIEENKELLKNLFCSTLKLSLLDDPLMTLGYLMLVTKNRFGKIQCDLKIEMISYDAYVSQLQHKGIENLYDIENVRLTSPMGTHYNFWMPIYINANHYAKSIPMIKNSINILKFGTIKVNSNTADFDLLSGLEIMCLLLNKTVVNMLNGKIYESENAIIAYGHLLRMLMEFVNNNSDIRNHMNSKIDSFKKKPANGHKNIIGDMGEFIIQCMIVKRFDEIKQHLLEEYFARQILWMNKANVYINHLNSTNLQTAFDACKISNQLLIFSIESAKTFIIDDVARKLDARHGFIPTNVMEFFKNRIVEIKSRVTNYPFLCRILNLPITSDEQMLEFLTKANDLSRKQSYTK